MKGSIDFQMGYLSTFVSEIGQSKYEAKEEAKELLASQGISATSERIAENTGIYSVKTMENYMNRWQELGEYAKAEFGIRDMGKLDGEAVKAFLNGKVEEGVSYSHFQQYCGAFGKLEQALQTFAQDVKNIESNYGFRDAINEVRPISMIRGFMWMYRMRKFPKNMISASHNS
jgi:hypothetical protein